MQERRGHGVRGEGKALGTTSELGKRGGRLKGGKGQCMQHPRETAAIMVSVTERAALGSGVGPGGVDS